MCMQLVSCKKVRAGHSPLLLEKLHLLDHSGNKRSWTQDNRCGASCGSLG